MKSRFFIIETTDGEFIEVQTPKTPLSLDYAKNIAYHWAKIPKNKVKNVNIK